MGFFNKRKKAETPPPQKQPSVPTNAPTTPDVIVEPSLDKPELLAIVAEKCKGAEKQGEFLFYAKHSLHLTVEFGDMRCINGVYTVQLLFIAQHPWFDEDLVESVAGIGKTPDDAMRQGTEEFCAGVLYFLLAAFDCESDTFIDANVRGEKHTFRVPCVRSVLHKGAGRGTDLFEVVRDELPHYLGTKRCYWIKLFSATMNGEPTCEVRINGIVYPDITDMLYREAIRREKTEGFVSDKQFILLIQQEDTWTLCPFDKQQVGEKTFHALCLMQEIHDEESAQRIMQSIRDNAPSHSLGLELAAFIPEIVAQQVVNFRDNDGLMPVVNGGKPDVELKKSQVRSYGYIDDAVFQFLHKQKPTEDEIKQLLAVSAKFHVLSEAIQKGTKIEDLRISQLVYFVDDDYIVW